MVELKAERSLSLEQLQRRSWNLTRALGIVQDVSGRIGGEEGPEGLNIVNPDLNGIENPLDQARVISQRAIRVAEVRKYIKEIKVPNLLGQIAQTDQEIQERKRSEVLANIEQIRKLRAYYSTEQLQALEEQFRKVDPAIILIPQPTAEDRQITYEDIAQRIIFVGGKKPAPAERRLIEAFLPWYKQSTIEGPDLLEAIKPGTSWEHGRKAVLGPAIYGARKALSGTNVEIRNVSPVGGAHHVKGRYFMDIGPMPEVAEAPAPPPAPAEPAQPAPVPVEAPPAAPPEDDFWVPKLETSVSLDQRRALRAAVLRGISGTDESKQFWAGFLESEATNAIFKSCSAFRRTTKQGFMDEEEVKLFFRHGSGSLTEWLAHYYYHPIFLQEGLTMLSPHQKFILYANGHRDKKPKDSEFGLNPEIGNVPSPDSLLIKPMPEVNPEYLEVISAVECKVVTEMTPDAQKRMEDQEADYTYDNVAHHLRLDDPRNYPEMPARLGRLLHILDPDLPALPLRVSEDMTVIYITPIDNPPLPVNVKPKTIPPTTGQIGHTLRVLTGEVS